MSNLAQQFEAAVLRRCALAETHVAGPQDAAGDTGDTGGHPTGAAAPLTGTISASGPRLIRLAARLELAPLELKALLFLVLCEAGYEAPSEYEKRGIMAKLSTFTGMSGGEVMAFLSPERSHMRQCILEVDDEFNQV